MSQQPNSIDAGSDNFAALVEQSHQRPVLVDFWASWCGPCKSLMPVLEKLAAEYQGQFLLAKVNIDEQQELATQFGVRSVPTVKLLRGGQVVDEFTGAQPEGQVRALLERYIERESDRLLAAAVEDYQRGEVASALEKARSAQAQDPDNPRVLLGLAELLLAAGELDEARSLVDSLPADLATEPAAQAIRAQLELAQVVAEAPEEPGLEQRLAAEPGDSQARHQLAAYRVLHGDYEHALEEFLELMKRDRSYGDDAGRRGMLQVFELLGGEGELVQRYRRAMFNVLH